MAVTSSLLAVLSLFADLGLSRASIYFEHISEDELSSLFWMNLLAGIGISLLFAAAAPLLGRAYHLAGLTPVLLAISPIFAVSAAGSQFQALASKQLRFRALAFNEVSSVIVGCVVAIWLAFRGFGVYSMVAGSLITTATSSALAWLRLPGLPRPHLHFKPQEAKPFLRFGGFLTAQGIINAVSRQSDIFIAGLQLDASTLGFFSVPRNMSLRIGMIVNPIITRIGFPVMARLQSDRAAVKSVYLQTLRMTSSLNFPAYVALGLFADEVVALLYGPHWHGAGVYLRILAAWGLVRSTGNPVGSLLNAMGAVKRALVWNLAVILILPLLYWVSMKGWGLPGLAAGLVIGQTALVLPSWYFLVRPCCGATVGEYLQQLATPLVLSAAAGGAAWMATRGVPHGTLRIAIGGMVGGFVYLALSYRFNRRWFDAMWLLFKLPVKR